RPDRWARSQARRAIAQRNSTRQPRFGSLLTGRFFLARRGASPRRHRPPGMRPVGHSHHNAGIGSGGSAGRRETSQDGHELRFAVNYLAGFLLTRVLLPLLMLGEPARIVNVSSLGQHAIDFDDVMLTGGYSGSRAYAQSKLAQIMFTFDLARELDPATVTANCLHPATYMATTMVRQSGVTPISTVEEGAQAILNLAVADELDGHSGEFYNGLRPSKANPQAYDDTARERLRMLSLQLTGLT